MLERNVLIDGQIYNRHAITLITHNIGIAETIVTVESSNDSDSISRSTSFYLADGLTIAEAEAFMWSLDMYAEYVDENTEALNEVLNILTDEQAETVPQLYPEWTTDISYAVGKRVRYDGKLYRCVQAHTSRTGWEPDITPALWVRTAPEGTIPDWAQPTGAQDAYAKGDKVIHNGKTWTSTVDDNVWEPGVYGWAIVN